MSVPIGLAVAALAAIGVGWVVTRATGPRQLPSGTAGRPPDPAFVEEALRRLLGVDLPRHAGVTELAHHHSFATAMGEESPAESPEDRRRLHPELIGELDERLVQMTLGPTHHSPQATAEGLLAQAGDLTTWAARPGWTHLAVGAAVERGRVVTSVVLMRLLAEACAPPRRHTRKKGPLQLRFQSATEPVLRLRVLRGVDPEVPLTLTRHEETGEWRAEQDCRDLRRAEWVVEMRDPMDPGRWWAGPVIELA